MTTGLDPRLTFATVVSGAANQLALAAARAVAESPRPPFNPLVVCGPVGLGKTHLLHAIGHRALEVAPRATVLLARWPELVGRWQAARTVGHAVDPLTSLREASLLLLDECDGLARPGASRDALLAMLEERLTQRRTTVIALEQPPTELLVPEDPACRLLVGGLVVELAAPDSAMRWEMLHRLSEESGTPLSPGVLEEIAALPFESTLELVGAAHRLLAFQSVSPTPLEPGQARVLVTGVVDEARPDAGVPAAPVAPARPALEPRDAAVRELDEFGSFLSDVVASVSEQIDEWRARIADAIARWGGDGYSVTRLDALLRQETPPQPDLVLQGFEADIAELQRLEAALVETAPGIEVPPVFRDPDRVGAAADFLEQTRVRELADSLPQSQFLLENLVEGSANREALEAARFIVSSPAEAPRPLLIVGDSGVGKTHLLHGIGNALVKQDYRGVVCQTLHGFQAPLLEADESGQLASWRRRHRWVTALLLDDLHLVSPRPVVQEELAGLLDRLGADGAPVVVTSAVPLAALEGVSPQLLARLGAGQTVELAHPDRELRLGLVRHLLAATEGADDPSLADYLAGRPADSVRAVLLAVQRVLRAAAEQQCRPSQALARQVLEAHAAAASRARGQRAGVFGPSLGSARFREKLVDRWPGIADRLVEELR